MDAGQLAIEILGGIVVGASLGLIGAGGAILSLPIFALALGHPNRVAGIEALIVTGAIATYSAAGAAVGRRIDFRRALAFAIPGIVGAWLGAPVGGRMSEWMHASLFAALALLAAWRMVARAPVEHEQSSTPDLRALALAAAVGLAIGLLTSIIGVGGGFLLIPALVVALKMPMRLAVGTSLLLIATNSAVAFLSHVRHSEDEIAAIGWSAVGIVVAGGIAGSTAGSAIGSRLPAAAVRKVFAVVLVLVAAGVLLEHALHAPS